MNIVELKHDLNQMIHNILCEYNQSELDRLDIQEKSAADNRHLQNINESLLNDNRSKDTIIEEVEKTNQNLLKQCHEYSEMINKLHEEIGILQIEDEEKNKFNIIRVQAKDIQDKNNEIERLQQLLTKKSNKIDQTIDKVKTTTSEIITNIKDKEVSNEKENKEDKEDIEDIEDKEEELKDIEDKEEELKDEELKGELSITDDKSDSEKNISEEDEISVDTITYRRKDYFIIDDEIPQYVYLIGKDDELGDRVGEYITNEKGKKVVKMFKK